MKKNYFLAALAGLLATAGSLVAQPTLTVANMPLPAGLTYTNVQHSSTGVTPGPGGANQTWDFSNLGQGTNPVTATVHETAGSPYANSFPGSTHYTTNTGDNTLAFVSYQGGDYEITGVMLDNAPVFTYTDPMKILVLPFTYNSDFTDQYTSTFVSAGASVTRTGNVNTVADGYGTLVLPNGQTYTDVLRFKITDQITDMITGFPMPVTGSTESYYWYKVGLPAALFSIVSATNFGQTSTAVVSLENTTVNAPEALSSNLQVYPNPAKGKVSVRTNLGTSVSATLVNSLGQEISKQTLDATEDQFSLDGVSSGVYFLQLQSGGRTVTKKLIVE